MHASTLPIIDPSQTTLVAGSVSEAMSMISVEEHDDPSALD